MKKRLIYLLLIVLAGSAVYAQDSLNVYLQTAAKNNPTVMQRYNEYLAALEKLPQVGSLPDPQLEAGFFLSPMEIISGRQVADIKLMQMFPWFGVLKNAKDEMNLMAKAKFEVFRDAQLQMFYEVQKAWFELYRISKEKELTAENMDLLSTIEKLTLTKFEAGNTTVNMGSMKNSNGSLSDVYLIKIEKANLENSLKTLDDEKEVAVARFNSLLNRPLQTSVSLPDTLLDTPLDLNYLSVNDSLFSNNPMLDMITYEQQSLSARERKQKQQGLPMVGIGLSYSVIEPSSMSTSSMNGQDMIMPMVSISLPLYRKKYNAMQRETKLLREASSNNYTAAVNELQTRYLEALQQYYDAQRRIKLYANQSQMEEKSLKIYLQSFASGTKNLTDILAIQRRLLDYEQKQVNAVVDFNKAKALVIRLAVYE
ncbi:MAG: TolC family protein [Paludibacter sp.]|nr:TolC family protein [Paludibacter sp.]